MATTTHNEHGGPVVYEQFETYEQQTESYIVGMWTFLVTEIMFFGALFVMYSVYRWKYQHDFYELSQGLNWQLGGINTMILLTSSFTMVLAVHHAQKNDRKKQLQMLGATIMCAFGFLVVKAFEWADKFAHNKVPGPTFSYVNDHGVNERHAELFYSMYFGMTGLHGLHVVIGIAVIAALMGLTVKDKISDYIPTEMVGLYWHFVDLVWIFLFPLFYLIPK